MSNHLPTPPRIADRLLSWFLRDELWEEVSGDLIEKYEEIIETKSVLAAKANYWYQVFNYLRPFALRRRTLPYSTTTVMLRNYLLIAFRNITKHQFYSTINVMSLAIGIAACLLIFLFIADERGFDQQHSKKDDLYRLCEVQTWTGTNEQNVALSMSGMGPTITEYFPEVVNYSRYWNRGKSIVQKDERTLALGTTAFVDSTFLKLFDYPLLYGDRATCLDEPRSLLLTRESAMKIFNDVDVVGQSIELRGESHEITGILEDLPEQSHLQYDALVSMTAITREYPEFNSQSGSNFLVTYLELAPNPDLISMAERYPDYLIDYTGDEEINEGYQLFVQRLEEVHLASTDVEHDYQNYRKFNGEYLGIFTLVAIFIMVIATVNFMNLSVARASRRAKEVGVRKSVGANKPQLFWQFIIESILLSFAALVIALLIDFVGLIFLNGALERELSLLTIIGEPLLLVMLIGSLVLLGTLAGLYPSVRLSSFEAATVLKGGEIREKKAGLQSVLIVTQFSLVLAMIVATIIVSQQLNYMRDKDLGFNKDHILLVDMNGTANEKYDVIKEELLRSSNIKGVTASGQRLGSNFHQWGWKTEVDTGMYDLVPSNVLVDYDYLDVYEIEIKEGRSFSKEFSTDDGLAFIINESFAKDLPYDDPVGRRAGHGWYPNDSLGNIIGVVEDFHFNSLHFDINNLSLVIHTEWGFDEMSIKLNGENIEAGVADVERIWSEMVPDFPMDYSFLDEHFDELYKSDQNMSLVVTLMAVLSILIGAMGLFGLSAVTIQRRIKEVGIRKVLGASVSQILVILSSRFALLILISFAIAAPVTYYYLDTWLENFAYGIGINLFIFLVGGLAAFAIAMLTISYHTLRAANSNPVRSLRYE